MARFKNKISDLNITDELNPELIFQMTDMKLLVGIVKDQIDIKQIARDELGRRGLSQNSGKWIGLELAKEEAETLIWNSGSGNWVSIPKN